MKRLYWLTFFALLICSLFVITVSASPPETRSVEVEWGQNRSADETAMLPNQAGERLTLSTWAITRTEDTDPAILYTGSWTAVTNTLLTGHASHADFTKSSTTGDSAAFDFSGNWIHLGFATDWKGGEADILIDGVSQKIIDLYTREIDVASFVFDGLSSGSHTLTIIVAGTKNAYSSGLEVKLDFVDTWDGTLMPDGAYEETSPRVWYSSDWDFIS